MHEFVNYPNKASMLKIMNESFEILPEKKQYLRRYEKTRM